MGAIVAKTSQPPMGLIPTIHMGVAASQMEKKGIRTDRGNINRQTEVTNNQMNQLRARIRKSKDWLYTQPLTETPNMMTVMNNIYVGKNAQSNYNTLRNLKARASGANEADNRQIRVHRALLRLAG